MNCEVETQCGAVSRATLVIPIPMNVKTVRILVVDDSAIFLAELRLLLEARVGWKVCGEAVDGTEGIRKNRTLKPHLIIEESL